MKKCRSDRGTLQFVACDLMFPRSRGSAFLVHMVIGIGGDECCFG